MCPVQPRGVRKVQHSRLAADNCHNYTKARAVYSRGIFPTPCATLFQEWPTKKLQQKKRGKATMHSHFSQASRGKEACPQDDTNWNVTVSLPLSNGGFLGGRTPFLCPVADTNFPIYVQFCANKRHQPKQGVQGVELQHQYTSSQTKEKLPRLWALFGVFWSRNKVHKTWAMSYWGPQSFCIGELLINKNEFLDIVLKSAFIQSKRLEIVTLSGGDSLLHFICSYSSKLFVFMRKMQLQGGAWYFIIYTSHKLFVNRRVKLWNIGSQTEIPKRHKKVYTFSHDSLYCRVEF